MSPSGPNLHARIEEAAAMSRDDRRTCPPWCVADHAEEDEAGTSRHRSETIVVSGMTVRPGSRRTVEAVEILIELHAEHGDPVVGVYIGDGERDGLDITMETADRLVRRLGEVLLAAGTARPASSGRDHQPFSAVPNSSPST
jgi:hypothetical protein